MTTYVITVPGTFLHDVTEDQLSGVERRLRPRDPHNTELGEAEELELLTVQEGNTFSLRLEIEAHGRADAEAQAKRLAEAALRENGLTAEDAPLGPAVVTGIDSEY
ncbi:MULTISPECIES: hypothetical protein [unclassified Streptomyces]|uniref:hypothetical protein n=1 Tax=Streptomyces TaxID=1883 RepID=UPI0001C1A770|nr:MULTISPECIES: hypothetical protein [unclassified Streptomyces]MYR66367.1 hypothetical protein [Streptomyces sp. SID4939]MYS03916.1 hypothetical protein [Streptomyces sp. SID4940]MYT66472.1 hypothetical protein [Streptomyces sp. SID8357]MYT83393.1 hypothetical protein [Streptomyces sp. SID8360]MYU34106.1 hypothetical protein [Streptomyces sp. SID8358]MYW35876.1 hypothetical protein [Streptomyces sp. SID1]MYX71869.1 hypothetical protein [Streptomyces sp. SID3915]